MRLRFLTPDAMPDGTDRICISVPSGEEWGALARGALAALFDCRNFEQYGSVTPEEAAQAFVDVSLDMMRWEVCMPVGAIIMYGADFGLPDGWLWCHGQQISRDDYPALYNAILDTYGGDEDGNFNVPNLQSRAPIGAGQGTGLSYRSIADQPGVETVTLTEAQLPQHRHTVGVPLSTGLAVSPGELPVYSGLLTNTYTSYVGSGSAHNNMQPSIALEFIIRAR